MAARSTRPPKPWPLVTLLALASSGCVAHAEVALQPGQPAPAFTAKGDDGKSYSLAQLHGKYVVLYFYPKDDSPGCTIEAKGFRDDSRKLEAKGAVVLGVSLDDAASHRAFREKFGLDFPLLVGGKQLTRLYGVPTTLGFAHRQTFVIGKDGKLLKIFRDVNPKGHADEILALLK